MSEPGSDNSKRLLQLRQTLQRVHAELQATPRVDANSSRRLREVLADIEGLLAEPAAPSRSEATHAPRIEALAVAFEAEHPTIAGSLRQLVDLLGRGGF